MSKGIIKIIALFLVSISAVTCGEGAAKLNASEETVNYQVERDVDLYQYSCDISEDGTVVYIKSTNEYVECVADELLEGFAWIPKK